MCALSRTVMCVCVCMRAGVHYTPVLTRALLPAARVQAMLEQTDSRIATLKREAYEFKRDVVIAGEDTRTGKLVAEKVEKYFADQLRAKDNMIDKLHLKNQVLRSTLVRLETLLKQKEDVGDVLHYIDFHQLQIENKQYLAKIEEKNAELLRLKLSTGQTVQSLNTMKIRLSAVSKEMTRLRADIRSRGVLLSRLRTENERLCDAITSAQELGVTLARQAREASDMPTIMDYVELKTMQSALAAELSSWKRKLEVTELAATQTAAKMGLPRAAVEELARTGAGAPSSAGRLRQDSEGDEPQPHGRELSEGHRAHPRREAR
ncbi:coiled-coil domain-containing protein, partial [archaeon]